MKLTCIALRGDGAELDTKRMPCVLEVLEGVAVAADTSELLATAVGKATGKTQPEIGRKIALGALVRNCRSAASIWPCQHH